MSHLSSFFLFRRSNGIWYISYKADGKRSWKSTGCREKSGAIKILRAMQLDAPSPEPVRPIPADLNCYLAEFLAFAEATYQPATTDIYKRVAGYLAALAGKMKLNELTPKLWDDYMVLRSRTVSSVTVQMEQRTLKALMNKAVEWEYLIKSPFAKSKKVRVPEVPPKYFMKEEFERLLRLVREGWLRQAIVFSISTGIRRGELINLRWADVDLARRIIIIQSSTSFRVKGNKSRIVPLSSVALEIILRQRQCPACPYVFTLNGRPLPGNWMSGLFRKYVKQAGLYDRKLHWHNLRSSFASWLVSGGVSLYAVSKLLGHSTMELTQTHYARLAPETLHSTVELIREIFQRLK